MKKIHKYVAFILCMAQLFVLCAPTVHASGGAVQISTAEGLAAVAENLDGNYVLMNDIDLSGFNGGNWIPLGGNENPCFSGTFDGGGHKITGLNISSADLLDPYTSYLPQVGLFGYVSGGALIQNLGVETTPNGKVTMENGGIGGILVAHVDNATINNCYSIGRVECKYNLNSLAPTYIGGLIGYMYPSSMGTIPTVTNCYSTADIFAENATSQPDFSTSSTSVYTYAGGLVGYNINGIINNCYAGGTVSTTGVSKTYAGGLCGASTRSNMTAANAQVPALTNVYATGSVSAFSTYLVYAGKVAASGNTTLGSLYDLNSSFIESTSGSFSNISAQTHLSLIQMKSLEAFTGFNSSIWGINAAVNNGLPYLKSMEDMAMTIQSLPSSPAPSLGSGNYLAPIPLTFPKIGTNKVYYTLDGSAPSAASTPYTTPISIAQSCVLKLFATTASGEALETKSYSYTINNTSAATVADAVTLQPYHAQGSTLVMPTMPEGFSITIKTSGNSSVIALNGGLTKPASDTIVNVVFTVTKLYDSTSAETAPIPVTVRPAPTVLTFWHCMTGRYHFYTNIIIDDFNKGIGLQNNIQINCIFKTDYTTVETEIKNYAAAGDKTVLPDLAQLSSVSAATLLSSDVFRWMEDYKDELNLTDVNPKVLQLYNYRSRLAGVPFSSSSVVLHYNADMFRAAGLDPDNPPHTLEELATAAQLLNVKSGDTVTRYGLSTRLTPYQLTPMIRSQSTQSFLVNQNNGYLGIPKSFTGNANGELSSVLTEFKTMAQTGVIDYKTNAPIVNFEQSKTAMYIDTMVQTSTVNSYFLANPDKKFEHRVALIPTFSDDNTQTLHIGGSGIYLMDRGANQNTAAALKFLEYWLSKDAQVKWAETARFFPSSISALNSAEFNTYINERAYLKDSMVLLKTAESDSYDLRSAKYTDISNNTGAAIESYMSGSKLLDETISAIENSINASLAGNISSLTAQNVANELKYFDVPAPGTNTITLPSVPPAFALSVKSSSNTAIVTNNGTIISNINGDTSLIVLTVTKLSDGTKADTSPILFQVENGTAVSIDVEAGYVNDASLTVYEKDANGNYLMPADKLLPGSERNKFRVKVNSVTGMSQLKGYIQEINPDESLGTKTQIFTSSISAVSDNLLGNGSIFGISQEAAFTPVAGKRYSVSIEILNSSNSLVAKSTAICIKTDDRRVPKRSNLA